MPRLALQQHATLKPVKPMRKEEATKLVQQLQRQRFQMARERALKLHSEARQQLEAFQSQPDPELLESIERKLEQALDLYPEDAELHASMAYLAYLYRELPQARYHLTWARQLAPDHPELPSLSALLAESASESEGATEAQTEPLYEEVQARLQKLNRSFSAQARAFEPSLAAERQQQSQQLLFETRQQLSELDPLLTQLEREHDTSALCQEQEIVHFYLKELEQVCEVNLQWATLKSELERLQGLCRLTLRQLTQNHSPQTEPPEHENLEQLEDDFERLSTQMEHLQQQHQVPQELQQTYLLLRLLMEQVQDLSDPG